MSKTVVLITGANTGLGYQMVRALCDGDRPYAILVGGRSLDKAQKAVDDAAAEFPSTQSSLRAIQVDIESDASIEAAEKTVREEFGKLDALVNNAGASYDNAYNAGEITMREAWNRTWDVNVAGTQVMTHAFVPLLLKSSDPRLLFIASGTSPLTTAEDTRLPFNRIPEAGWPKNIGGINKMPAYRSSKTGMNMMMREWARILHADGVKVWALSPGYLATGLGGSQEKNKAQGAQDPAVAGPFVREVLEGRRDDQVGKVIKRDGEVQSW